MLGYADYVFTSVFTVEIVLKVTAAVVEIDNIALISSTLDQIVINCAVFFFFLLLLRSRLDDSLRSFSAHRLLL